ncbi:MAG: T9SS type A sorting domain-containing protein [Saprospiraceae bacterium]|nr:T9SS type A sorting domain-containing protein [Saprospiraceae bacterium]
MKRLLPYLLFCLVFPASAQGWRQTFGGMLSPAGMCQTPDGGAVLLANSVPGGSQGRQVVLTKTDQDGRVQWQKSFGAAGDDEGRSLLLSAAGDLIVAGKMAFMANNGDAFLVKYDLGGQKIWERVYNFGVLDDAKCMRQTSDGGFILALEADNQLRLLRTDAQGMELWTKAFPATAGLSVKHLEIRSDGGLVVTMLRNNLPIGAPAAVVLQLNMAGDAESEVTLPHYSSYITTDQVRCLPATDSTFWLMHRDSLYLLDRDTTVLKRWEIATAPDFYLTDIATVKDGGVLALGTNYSFSGQAFSHSVLIRFQADGTELWRRNYEAPSTLHSTWSLFPASDGGFFLSGNYAKGNSYFSYLLRTDSLGQTFTNQISGRLFYDENLDCTHQNAELPLKSWVLKLVRPNGDIHYCNTNAQGNYHIEAGLGEHTLSVLLPNGLWQALCQQDVPLVFSQPFQSDTVDFPIKNAVFCPLPRVDAGVDYWIACQENTFWVQYANAGVDMVADAVVTLTLDTLLSITGASIPFSQSGPQSWAFPVGDLQALSDSGFQVQVMVDCAADILDRTLCVHAEIDPADPCLAPIADPLLVIDGRCEGDSVRFHVFNLGAPMTEPRPYIVVEDNIIFLQSNGEFLLDSGAEWIFSVPANGSTWRMEILQDPDMPDWLADQVTSAVVEGCSNSGGFSTGFVNQFSQHDGGYFAETECRPVVPGPQGLQKAAFPAGWTDEHLIQANTDLEYSLHFQNLTGQTIHTLTLRDTLDAQLNPGVVLAGPASHPYQWELMGEGVVSFRFANLALADSARVWVKFRVSQDPDLPPGAVILNQAWAYADFLSPQPTNETYHTIGHPVFTETKEPIGAAATKIRLYPNPTSAGITIALSEKGMYQCRVMDATGKTILNQNFHDHQFQIPAHALPAGVFMVTIHNSQGKLIGQQKGVRLTTYD